MSSKSIRGLIVLFAGLCAEIACAQTPPPIQFTAGKLGNSVVVDRFAVQADGKVIAAGAFDQIDGVTRKNVARLNADGTLDTSWNPGTNGQVNQVLHHAGVTYVAGQFSEAGGAPRNGLAAFDSTGALTAWNPNPDASVLALAAIGSTVFVGGQFSQIGGAMRANLAALDASTGIALAWDPAPDDSVSRMVVAGNDVIVAGRFSTIAGQTRAGTARFDSSLTLTAWSPAFTFSGSPSAPGTLLVTGDDLLAIGFFNAVDGIARNNIALVSLTTGALAPFSPTLDSVTTATVTGSTVYLGGQSLFINGVSRRGLGAIDLTTGNEVTGLPIPDDNAQGMRALAVSNGHLFVGGQFEKVGAADASGIARIDLTNLANVQGRLVASASGRVNSFLIQPDGKVIIGGDFHAIGPHVRRGLARFNADGSVDTSWNPGARGYGERVTGLASDGTVLYVSGDFDTLAGVPREYMGALDANGNATAWNPQVNSLVNAVLAAGGFVYLGGSFSSAGGAAQNQVSQIDASSGLVGVNLQGLVVPGTIDALILRGSTLYAAGSFNFPNDPEEDPPFKGFAAFDIVTGSQTAWNPVATGNSGNAYNVSILSNARALITGRFTHLGGAPRASVGIVNLTSGAVDPWQPSSPPNLTSTLVHNDVFYSTSGAYNTAVNSNNALPWTPPPYTAPIMKAEGNRIRYLAATGASGAGAHVIDSVALATVATPAVTLGIVNINNGNSPAVAANFTITVESRDANNLARAVLADTTLSVTVHTGGGVLSGGTTSCVILAGTSSCTFAGLRYSAAEAGVRLTVTRVSGDTLTAITSAPFNVKRITTLDVVKVPEAVTEVGQPATFVATINGGVIPTGTVAFELRGGASTGIPDCQFVPVINGTATCTTSSAQTGIEIAPRYSGDATHFGAVTPYDYATLIAPVPTVTVTKSGGGAGTITSSPAGVDCGVACASAMQAFPSGTMLVLTATPDANSVFLGWSGMGCSGTGACNVALPVGGGGTVSARFEPPTVSLTVTRNGAGSGTVVSSPAGLNCGTTCTAPFSIDAMVTLTASPASNSNFTGWAGAGCSGTGTCIVSMSEAQTVSAAFELKPNQTLTVTSLSNSGTVASSPPGIVCGATCSASFPYGTVVTLTATPAATYAAKPWGGACSGLQACTVTLTAATNVTVDFDIPPELIRAVSAKVHGTNAFGSELPIALNIPIDGLVSVEPRSMGAGHELLFDFGFHTIQTVGAITVTDAAMQPIPGLIANVVSLNHPETGIVRVRLTGVPDGQRLRVTLTTINGFENSFSVNMGFLLGDIGGTGVVTAADVAAAKTGGNGSASIANLLRDIDLSGTVNASDVAIVKSRVGRRLE